MPTLHSKILGEGQPLLILHGFLGMSDNWKTLGNKYAEEGLQVHLIDQRNHGKSFHSTEFNYDILANDIKQYIAEHNLQNCIVLGHSMGGKTAMQLACSYPELVNKLLIADIAPKFYPPHHHEIINGLKALDLNTISSRTEASNELAKHISNAGVRQFLLKNLYWVEKGKLAFRFNLDVLAERMEQIGENIDASATYNKPTLFLRGDKSEYISPLDTDTIKTHFPNADIQTITNSGHWLHAENPKEFLEKSLTFIKS
ncbi:alpha/beta fold hydrolase [Cellulophaga lytica]|uniref:Alpha/beta hydrolase fold protein n=1 Tax=Cellulophaga lytica (strain ATCC 23178 / DSM 7489 / JCM 8516 / NBRC 14961 / NCIMB 1423 / VKM B-1433 / Cy l20) TaxID=867900 RepID=F0RD61_CELLC|nr:alpha/beta fold hydrolase [Cellulophaga lytica]ADY29762.1 alpha/beta hydrolase fold protein [Cellulophaga lytica DSM 7489]WQG76069.1 alpha/beta fold hydrolase [Cellulophaga lytica]